MSTKAIIEEVLTEMPESKDDDRILIFEVWKRQGFHVIAEEPITELTSPETIRRIRQNIQSPKGEDRLHASEVTINKRQKREQEFHNKYSKDKFTADTFKNSQLNW